MKGDDRKLVIYRRIGGRTYRYVLRKKKCWDSPARVRYHFEYKYVSAGALGGKNKKPATLDALSDSQIERLRAWRAEGASLVKLNEELEDWGFYVSHRTMTRFLAKQKITKKKKSVT